MAPTLRYPSGPVTPHGAYYILNDRIPQMTLTAYDESIRFDLMGGLAIPDRQAPERVEVKDLKGLVPPWVTIDQKGATEDGITFIDALYDPIEVELGVVCHGRNPAYCRKVGGHLIASLDAKQESRLSWFTHDMGYWWAPLRWFKTPASNDRPASKRQEKALRLRADSGFWQSFPDVDQFHFNYVASSDNFTTDDPDDLGTGWTVNLSGGGSGGVRVTNGEVQSTLNNRTMVARRNTYTTATDDQVVEIQIGRLSDWFFSPDSAVDVWLREAPTGTPGADGVRVRIQRHKIIVSAFVAGTETVLRTTRLVIPPVSGERFRVVAGAPLLPVPLPGLPAEPRRFKVLRNGAPLINFKENGTTSQIGAGFRSVGFGLYTSSSTPPPGIRAFTVGTNAVETQSGFLRRINAGDQEMWDRYTCFGPGTFYFGNGPGSTDMVKFGPLLPGQVAQVRTDPRKYGVKDLTATPATPAQQASQANAISDFLSFITFNNVTHLLDVFQSVFGLFGGGSAPVPPQGNLYRLLNGRFSNPIPAKSPGNPAKEYFVKVQIEGGNADSSILAAGTPKRRYPY